MKCLLLILSILLLYFLVGEGYFNLNGGLIDGKYFATTSRGISLIFTTNSAKLRNDDRSFFQNTRKHPNQKDNASCHLISQAQQQDLFFPHQKNRMERPRQMQTAWCLPLFQFATGSSMKALRRFTEWIQFRLQMLLMGPIILKFAFFLLLLICLVTVGTLTHSRIVGCSWKTSAFKTYSWIQNSPGADAMNEPTVLATFTANALYVIGLTCFSFYLGVMNSAIAGWTQDIKEGNLKVAASQHTLLLNWSDQTIPLLRQVTIAGHNYRNFGPRTVVIMANKEKSDMDAAIRSSLSQRELRKVRVITRSGDPSLIEDLENVGAHRAKRSIIMPPSYGNDAEEQMMVQSIALQGAQMRRNGGSVINTVVYTPPTIQVCSHAMFPKIEWPSIELRSKPTRTKRRTAPNLLVMQESSFVGRLIAQTVHHPGLPRIYSELMEERPNSCEFYPAPLNKWPWLAGLKFDTAWKYFPRAVLCGVIRDGRAIMAPPGDFKLQKDDILIMISQTQKMVNCRRTPMFKEISEAQMKEERVVLKKVRRAGGSLTKAQGQPGLKNKKEIDVAGEDCSKKKCTVITLLNYSPGHCDILLDLDRVSQPGTKVIVLCDENIVTEAENHKMKGLKYKNITPVFKYGNPLDGNDLRNSGIAHSDCIIVLQRSDFLESEPAGKLNEKSSKSDTESITTLAHIQGILKETAEQAGATTEKLKRPRVIAQVCSPEVKKIITEMTTGPLWGKSDIFLPKHIESGVVVQVCLDRDLTTIFESLLQPEGVELGFRNPLDYGYKEDGQATTFYEISEKARQQGEIAIGVERREGMHRADWGEYLNPNKYDELIMRTNDRIVVLTEEQNVHEEV